jgi:hypothetical protein
LPEKWRHVNCRENGVTLIAKKWRHVHYRKTASRPLTRKWRHVHCRKNGVTCSLIRQGGQDAVDVQLALAEQEVAALPDAPVAKSLEVFQPG